MFIEVDYYINKAAYNTVNDTSYCGLQPYKLYTTLTIKTNNMIKRRKLKGGARAWTKRIDLVFQKWVKLNDTNKEGYGTCCTCNKPLHYKEANAGHYQPRQFRGTRWHEENVRLQCIYCNQWLAGAQYAFAKFLGFKKADELEELSRVKVTFTDEEYADIYYKYKELILELEATKV